MISNLTSYLHKGDTIQIQISYGGSHTPEVGCFNRKLQGIHSIIHLTVISIGIDENPCRISRVTHYVKVSN